VASLQAQQYYGHPRNQFWPLLAALWAADLADWPYAQRLALCCAARPGPVGRLRPLPPPGSLDSATSEAAEPNDLAGLVARCRGCALIAHNGGESARAMRITRALGLPVLRLPSTSPANASWSFERKRAAWRRPSRQAGLLG
jgi:hypoxanthine-DNA glycosylase